MSFRITSPFPSILLFVLVLMGCNYTTQQIAVAQTQPPDITLPVPLLIPSDSLSSSFEGLLRKSSVIMFYDRNGGKPVWIENSKYNRSADSLLEMLERVQYYGFSKSRYHWAEMRDIRLNANRTSLIRRDILLTDAFCALAHDLRFGITRSQDHIKDSVYTDLLNRALTEGTIKKTLESQEPVASGYQSLRKGLGLMLDSIDNIRLDSISFQENIQLISINLERWRMESQSLGERYIFINIPSFMLDVVENDSVILSSKVIVGTPEKETPVLSSKVECLSIYPYWHVPRKIAIEEYLPIIKKDTTFIVRNNFDVIDRKGNVLNPDSVKWSTYHENYFPIVLRQREGPENSLGIIKFVFENPHAVFLHDTNAKRLFNGKTRAYSHGCIRMEKAVELAHLLVTGKPGSESKYVNKFLKEKTQHWVDLKNPIPIHIRYFTCEFKHGKFFSYKDIYGKDLLLRHLLFTDTAGPDL